MVSTEFTNAFENLHKDPTPAEGFHYAEIWLSDGAIYRAADGYTISTDGKQFTVSWVDHIILGYQNVHMIPMQLDVDAREVVGCVIGPRFAPCVGRGVLP